MSTTNSPKAHRSPENRTNLGAMIRRFRVQRGIGQKAFSVALGMNSVDTRELRRYETNERSPGRDWLVRLALVGFPNTGVKDIDELLQHGGYVPLGPEERQLVEHYGGRSTPEPEKVRWGPLDNSPPGILIDGPGEIFIPWKILKPEVETRLINQLGRIDVPIGSSAELVEFHERKGWRVFIFSPSHKYIGRIWFGPDPLDDRWTWDGRVRVGDAKDDHTAEVWQVFQRYSDGSYRLVQAIR